MAGLVRRVPLWAWWIGVVWLVSLPWLGPTRHPQWHRVHWIPLTGPADRPRDLVANLLLFFPFGYSLAGSRRRGGFVGVAVLAALVSASAEATQLFSTDRYPSATDVLAAILGSAIAYQMRLRWSEPLDASS